MKSNWEQIRNISPLVGHLAFNISASLTIRGAASLSTHGERVMPGDDPVDDSASADMTDESEDEFIPV